MSQKFKRGRGIAFRRKNVRSHRRKITSQYNFLDMNIGGDVFDCYGIETPLQIIIARKNTIIRLSRN